MAKIIATTVYQLHELSDAARAKARQWYRADGPAIDWHEFIYDDFVQICDILGVELATRPVRLFGGDTRPKPCIWYSGFWSQGDGACFEGVYTYRSGASAAIRRHAPQDSELHGIADALQAVQARNFYQLRADVWHHGRYYHEYSMRISVERDTPTRQDMTSGAEDDTAEALRDLARWLYSQLAREYEFQNSDEIIDEAIIAADYNFTEDGSYFS